MKSPHSSLQGAKKLLKNSPIRESNNALPFDDGRSAPGEINQHAAEHHDTLSADAGQASADVLRNAGVGLNDSLKPLAPCTLHFANRLLRFGAWLTWTLLTALPLVSCLTWLFAAWRARRPRLIVTAGIYLLWPSIGMIASTILSAIFFNQTHGIEGWLDGVAFEDPHAILILWVTAVMWLVSLVNAQLEWRAWILGRRGHNDLLMRISDDAIPASRPYWICLVFWITLGWAGAHRFYTGRWITGLVYLATFGLLGAGWAADVFLLRRMLLGAPQLNGIQRVIQRAPWASEEEHQSWSDFAVRMIFFMTAPFAFVGFCVCFNRLELLAVLILVVVVCGLLGNLEQVIGRLDLLEKVPITRPAVAFINDLYKYYFETRPRPFLHYLLWPIYAPINAWSSASARQEMGLYVKFLATLYVVILVHETQNFSTHYHYMSPLRVILWFAFHLVFSTLVTATFIVPIVTTSFTLNLAGMHGRLRALSVIVLATTLPIAAFTYYQSVHGKTPTTVAWLKLEARSENPAFRDDLSWHAEVFLRHYLGRIPNIDPPLWSATHSELTTRFRQHIETVVEPEEALALEVRVVRELDTEEPTLAVIEKWNLGHVRRTRTLFTITGAGRFFSAWGRLPPRARIMFEAIEGDTPSEQPAYKIAQNSVAFDRRIYDVVMTCMFQAPEDLEALKESGDPTFQPSLTKDLRALLASEGIDDPRQFRIFAWDDGRNKWRCVRDAQYLWVLTNNEGEIIQQWDRPELKWPSRRLLYLQELEYFDPIDQLDLTFESDRQLARDLVSEHTRVFLSDAARYRHANDTPERLTRAYRDYIADLVPEHQRHNFQVVDLSSASGPGWLGIVYKDLPLFAADASGSFYARGSAAPTVARQFLNHRY